MISVIVPVYNTENYLEDCLDSILCQTYTDFELLVVNDGSKDNSLEILNKYATKDSRVRVFDKQNGGQSQARNMGLNNAKGDFIAFIDSDDVVAPNYLEVLFTAINKSKALMVQSKIARFYDKPSFEYGQVGFVDTVYFKNCYDNTNYVQCYNDSVSCKLFDKSLFDNLRFAEGEIFEDGKIIIQLWLRSKMQTNIEYCGYFYRVTPNSTMTTFNAEKDYEQIVVWENRKQKYVELGYEKHIEEINSRIIKTLMAQYCNAKNKNASQKDLNKLKVKIKEYMPYYKGNRFFGWKDKIFVGLCKISPNLYSCVHNNIRQIKIILNGGKNR